MIRVKDVKVPLQYDNMLLKNLISKRLKITAKEIISFSVVKRSLDAREKGNLFFVFSFDVALKNETGKGEQIHEDIYIPPVPTKKFRAVVVGSGPAGMFSALVLARAGLCPLVLERGRDADTRLKDVSAFFNSGLLDQTSNIQFGEGGAGTFSDGKLTTGTRDKHIPFVFKELVAAGAPEEILFSATPHIGTDKLVGIVKKLREKIEILGGKYFFESKVTGLKIENGSVCGVFYENNGKQVFVPADAVVLAVGHSARDTFEMLMDSGIAMRKKAFAVGVRAEHSQKDINFSQYGKVPDNFELPPSGYKLTFKTTSGRGVYSFCVCPGGTVVAAASEYGGICTNGMSNFARSRENCNGAIVVTVSPEDFAVFGEDALAGVRFQRHIETTAFELTNSYAAPAQSINDFLKRAGKTSVNPTYAPSVVFCELERILPKFITDSLTEALPVFERKISFFGSGLLTAPETRTSSPVTIIRTENGESVSVKKLFPAGEGAGYAGGIVSSAVDGIRQAENLIGVFEEALLSNKML